jgi:hypothetical protein
VSLEWVRDHLCHSVGDIINVLGDSKLIISFMNKQFIPGKRHFVTAVEKCRRFASRLKAKYYFIHIYRDNNVEADLLSKLALKYQFSGNLNAMH